MLGLSRLEFGGQVLTQFNDFVSLRSLRMGAKEHLLKPEESTLVQGDAEQWAYHFTFLAK